MAIVIFSLGLTVVNGLVKSTINTANSLSEKVDVTIFDIVSRNPKIPPIFNLNEKVQLFNLRNIEHFINEKYKEEEFYSEKQKFLTASYSKYDEAVLKEIDKRLSEDDLIIFVHPLAMKIYLKANPNSKVKKLIQIHGNYLEEIDNYNLIKEHFDEIDYIQTVSRYMRDDLINILGAPKEKTIYIPNIAVPVKINRVKHKYLKRISIIGSLQKRKNQLDAVKILEHIEDNNVILQIYGHELDKDYATLIKDYIKRKGLEHRVKFMGIAQENDIYSNSDLVILTSEHEGLPYIFFESAMYKIPVLAYDFKYGAKEFSQDGKNGCLFKMGDYISMASKISEIFEDEEICNNIVKTNSEFFEKAYAEDKIVEMYLQLGGRSKTTKWSFLYNKYSYVENLGVSNSIIIGNEVKDNRSKIRLIGANNIVKIGNNVKINHINITLKGNNIQLIIDDDVELTGTLVSMFQNTTLKIGKNTTIGKNEFTIAEETELIIGKDCMFAHNCEIRTSDMHPIYSLENGVRINGGKSIKIGNHVWLGKNSTILKGVTIENNTVVGINSIVTKSFEMPNIVIAGIPARKIKDNVIWGRKMYHKTMYADPTLIDYYDKEGK